MTNSQEGASGQKPKILLLTQYYSPEKATIPTDLSLYLSDNGLDVEVLTAFPSYPFGKIYEGYRQSINFNEIKNEIKIRRVPSFLSHSNSFLMRIINYLSFAFSALFMGNKIVKNFDIVYVYATPMTVSIPAVSWKLFFGVPFVLHIQDLWPESVINSGMLGSRPIKMISKLMTPWLAWTYRLSTGVIAIAPSMKNTLEQRGANKSKTFLVFNWGEESIGPRLMVKKQNKHKTNILFAGNFGVLQGLEIVIEAISKLHNSDDFEFIFVGEGITKKKTITATQDLKLKNVFFYDQISQFEMQSFYDDCDFVLIPLSDLPILKATIPSKFQTALIAGKPIITNAGGDLSKIVTENQLGISADPGDSIGLAKAFKTAGALAENEKEIMSRNALRYYRSKMSLDEGAKAISKILSSSINNN